LPLVEIKARELVEKGIPRRHDNIANLAGLNQRLGFLDRVRGGDRERRAEAGLIFGRKRTDSSKSAEKAQARRLTRRRIDHRSDVRRSLRQPVGQMPLNQLLRLGRREHGFGVGFLARPEMD